MYLGTTTIVIVTEQRVGLEILEETSSLGLNKMEKNFYFWMPLFSYELIPIRYILDTPSFESSN